MLYMDSCGCLLGVTLSAVLHNQWNVSACESNNLGYDHYGKAKMLPGGYKAEVAYAKLGGPLASEATRRRRLHFILKAEMRLRAKAKSTAPVAATETVMA